MSSTAIKLAGRLRALWAVAPAFLCGLAVFEITSTGTYRVIAESRVTFEVDR